MSYNNFNEWFSANYSALRTKCLPFNLFGELYNTTFEDVFHDTYLICVETTKDCKDSALYETIFTATYKAQSKLRYNAELNNVRPSDLFWSFLTADVYDISESEITKEKKDTFINSLMEYAKQTFSADEYTLFTLYFKNGLNQYEIADVFGTTQGAVFYRLGTMKQLLCMRFCNEFKNL